MVEISIIIVTLKSRSEIDCIPLFKESEFDDYEILIRRDDGISKARNKGIEEAVGNKIVFIDDDATPCENYLSIVSRVLDNHPIVAGKIVNPSDDIFSPYGVDYDQGDQSRYTTTIVGANMAFQRDVFDVIGDFDENFMWGHEDYELAERALYEYPIFYDPELYVIHTFSDSIIEFWKKRYQLGKADAYWGEKKGQSRAAQLIRIVNNVITPENHIHKNMSLKGSFVVSTGTIIRNFSRAKELFRNKS